MYSVNEVIHTLNTSLPLILLLGSFIFGAFYVAYLEAIRLGFRDQTHAIPIVANMYFFAHDVTFVLLFHRWFDEVSHWLYKGFWFALIVFVFMECVVHYQTIRYSGKELFPQLNQQQYIVTYLLMQVGVAILFYFIFTLLNDFLFLIHFSIALIWVAVFNIPMLISRGSRKRQSLVFAFSIFLGSSAFFFVFLPILSSSFRSLPFMLVGAALTVLNLVYIWLLAKFPNS